MIYFFQKRLHKLFIFSGHDPAFESRPFMFYTSIHKYHTSGRRQC